MNVELFYEIARHIQKDPDHFDMAEWAMGFDERWVEDDSVPVVIDCKTTACIAGHAVAIAKHAVFTTDDIEPAARNLLGIDRDQSYRIFNWRHWPTKFMQEYYEVYYQPNPVFDRKQQLADIAARRIFHFIDTEGAE